jgi:hypothetical protein
MISSNIGSIDLVATHVDELRRKAAQVRLAKTGTRKSRLSALGRSPRF